MPRLRLIAFALLVASCAGCCCERRIWRCEDGNCGVLSGRFDGSGCDTCSVCGEPMGGCRCGFFAALKRRWGCGAGCGESYWGDWISDPPAPCDPCDECTGDYLGRRCCPPKRKMLLGGRVCDGDCPQGQCQCNQ